MMFYIKKIKHYPIKFQLKSNNCKKEENKNNWKIRKHNN